jgi:hypothetical protein
LSTEILKEITVLQYYPKVKGVGCVRFQLESGGSLEVDEVMYVPELRVNFLSMSTLEDKGYAVMFEDGKVLI